MSLVEFYSPFFLLLSQKQQTIKMTNSHYVSLVDGHMETLILNKFFPIQPL